MKSPEGYARLCDDCPLRESEKAEGLAASPATGNLVDAKMRYLNAQLMFLNDPSETPDVPVDHFSTTFIDDEGNRTASFVAGTTIEDIAECEGPAVTARSGFFKRKKHYDCGAEALRLIAFRDRVNKSK